MVLSSTAYFIFLAAIFFLYWPFARVRALGLAAILFANYFLYAKWDLLYLFLIPAASTCDFFLAWMLDVIRNGIVRRLLVLGSLVLNLGLIASLKYMPFFLENWSTFRGEPAPEWRWVFPLGLSFYCFQSLTYTLDVYRRDAPATRSLLAYLSSVSFFPTTLAGPITRVAVLLPQFERKDKTVSPQDNGKALFVIGLGLVKKLLIADYLADNLVNRVFDFPDLYSGTEVLIGVYGYALQLYYDFSGYTDIALGSALLLGIKLPANFNRPYAAANIADFWRRWHISLSNWLRDYLYFSLPGKRSRIMPYFNLTLTMTLGGLWHGASWNFALWGLLHGLGLAVHRLFQAVLGKRQGGAPARVMASVVTVQFVCFTWIFFRAADLAGAQSVLARIGSGTVSFANISSGVALVLAVAALMHYFPERWYAWTVDRFTAFPFFAQAATLVLLALALQYLGASGAAPFIYTRF
ncbi:MAG: MBOAT family protein [Bryobacterales bacterium]|nr:MBOAT family protein [Bryobacterales bacterium]